MGMGRRESRTSPAAAAQPKHDPGGRHGGPAFQTEPQGPFGISPDDRPGRRRSDVGGLYRRGANEPGEMAGHHRLACEAEGDRVV
jgi:hypothetical protein